jgi:hypothetical protein
MILRSIALRICALLCVFTFGLHAADDRAPDKELERLETRLQTERASAVRARLVLYTDELKKL